MTLTWKLIPMMINFGDWIFRGWVLSPKYFCLKIVFKLFNLSFLANFFSLAWWRIKSYIKIEDFEAFLSWKLFGIDHIDHFFKSYVWFHYLQ